MKESEIRPDHLMEAAREAQYEDIAWLTSRADQFVDSSCPACDSSDSVFEFQKYSFQFFKCNKCATVFMKSRAPAMLLNEFYERSALYKYWNEKIFPATRSARLEKLFVPRAREIIEQFTADLDRDINVLDVGAGSGMFLEACSRIGGYNKVIGVEPNLSQRQTAEGLGLQMYKSFADLRTNSELTFDVVVSFETIEHVSNPSEFIQEILPLLCDGGCLYLTCPSYFGFDVQMLGVDSDYIDAEHINLFNPNSIETLLKRNGLVDIQVTTPGMLDVEIVKKSLVSGVNNIECSPFLKKLIFDDFDLDLSTSLQAFLVDNKLSSHMRSVGFLRNR